MAPRSMACVPSQTRCEANARQFREQHANVLRALRDFDLQQFFNGQAVAEIIRKRREIVDAVGAA